MKKSINSPIHLKNVIPGFYSDSLIIRVPNFNLFRGCTPCLAWAASCQWWDSVLSWKSAGSWGPGIEATVIPWLCDFHCYGACKPVLLETVVTWITQGWVCWRGLIPRRFFDLSFLRSHLTVKEMVWVVIKSCACGTRLRPGSWASCSTYRIPPLALPPLSTNAASTGLEALTWTLLKHEKQRTL